MRKTVIEYVADYAASQPEKVAVITKNEKTSYGELFSLVTGYADFLRCQGLKKADIVVLRASQGLDYVIQYLGIHLCGGIVTSLERNIADEGMVSIAEQLSADIVISDNDAFGDICRNTLFVPRGNIKEIAEEHFKSLSRHNIVFPDLNDSADILFTTGTTGASKGVELSHNALTATAENLIYGCGYKRDAVIVAPGPLNHANAIRKLFTTLVNGSTIYILNGMLSMKAFYDALEYPEGTICCCLPPAAIRTIFQTTGDKLGEYADKIDFIESATAPLPEPDKIRLCKLLPKTRLYNNYGSSESASVCMYDYNANQGKENCVGLPAVNSRVVIVDDDYRIIESSADRVGLIACIGDVNMKGYVNDPELTKEVLTDGVVYTSDIGYIGEDGYVYVVGRKGDVINVGGLKVNPTEVENAALAYEGVEDCICIAEEDPISGKALKLLVKLDEGTDLSVRGISRFLAARLESHKVPRLYEKVDEIKRTYNGKLDRKAYR